VIDPQWTSHDRALIKIKIGLQITRVSHCFFPEKAVARGSPSAQETECRGGRCPNKRVLVVVQLVNTDGY